MFHMGATLYIINVTTTDVKKCIDSVLDNPIKDILLTLQSQGLEVSQELLGKFQILYDNGHWYEAEV